MWIWNNGINQVVQIILEIFICFLFIFVFFSFDIILILNS